LQGPEFAPGLFAFETAVLPRIAAAQHGGCVVNEQLSSCFVEMKYSYAEFAILVLLHCT
jgi:hypothetical protein